MINQGQTTSFKQELYEGIHDFLTDSIYIALYDGNAMLTQATTVYSTANQVVGTGYTAGGKELQNATVNAADDTAYISFDNIAWTNASFTARCALIYNATKGNKSIAVLDFGSDKTVVNQTLTITFPANLPDSAIIRSS
jgi:hypothetical protein